MRCSPAELGPPINSFRSFELCDVSNNGNASDIELNLSGKTGSDALLEFRLFLIKEDDQIPAAIDEFKNIKLGRYHAFQLSDVIQIKGTMPSSTLKDIYGNEIMEQQRYVSALLSVSNNEELEASSIQINPEWFVLTQNDILSDFSKQFDVGSEIGAGSLTLFNDQIYMSGYDITDELSLEKRDNYSITRVDQFGKSSALISDLSILGGNAVNSAGDIFHSVIYENKVIKISPQQKMTVVNTGDFELKNPDGLFVNSKDEMFIVSRNSSQILKIDQSGKTSNYATILDANPKGITGDDDGNLYVSHNIQSGRISKIDANGQTSLFAEIPTFIPEDYILEYFMYMGYLQYKDGYVYVSGMSTDMIYRISMTGDVEAFAGSGMRGLPKGDRRKADLNRPNGIVFSADGNRLFISGSEDTNPTHTQSSKPSRVWKIDLIE